MYIYIYIQVPITQTQLHNWIVGPELQVCNTFHPKMYVTWTMNLKFEGWLLNLEVGGLKFKIVSLKAGFQSLHLKFD